MNPRYLGAIFVAAASTTFGVIPVLNLRRHIRLLDGLCSSLRIMAAELGTRLRPLPELICELAAKGGTAGAFYGCLAEKLQRLGETDFSALWSDSIEGLALLSADELSALDSLGTVLGRYELNEQLESIELCLDALSRSAALLRESYPDRRRLLLGLSAEAGFMTLIVLI